MSFISPLFLTVATITGKTMSLNINTQVQNSVVDKMKNRRLPSLQNQTGSLVTFITRQKKKRIKEPEIVFKDVYIFMENPAAYGVTILFCCFEETKI